MEHLVKEFAENLYLPERKNKEEMKYEINEHEILAIQSLTNKLYGQAFESGWHNKPVRPDPSAYDHWRDYVDELEIYADKMYASLEVAEISQKLMLIVTEVAEAMEGHRKDLMDDKLPHHKMVAVELADAIIRILDFCGRYGIDIGSIIAEKHSFNAVRSDHKLENRMKDGGKRI